MFIAHCVVCVLLAVFSFVVLCATDVCGEYSAIVLREGDVDARGPKYIYAAGGKRWHMQVILQSGQDGKEPLVTQVDQQDDKSPSTPDDEAKAPAKAQGTDRVKNQDGGVKEDDERASVSSAHPSTVGGAAGDRGSSGHPAPAPGKNRNDVQQAKSDGDAPLDQKKDKNGKDSVPEEPEGRRTDDASSSPAAPDLSKKQSAGGGGGGASQTEIKDQNAGGQGGQNGQSTTQPAETGETKKKESTTTSPTSQKTSESNTETTDFAVVVRAPLVFFSLLAALACVCEC